MKIRISVQVRSLVPQGGGEYHKILWLNCVAQIPILINSILCIFLYYYSLACCLIVFLCFVSPCNNAVSLWVHLQWWMWPVSWTHILSWTSWKRMTRSLKLKDSLSSRWHRSLLPGKVALILSHRSLLPEENVKRRWPVSSTLRPQKACLAFSKW